MDWMNTFCCSLDDNLKFLSLVPAGKDMTLRSIHQVFLPTWNSSHNKSLKFYPYTSWSRCDFVVFLSSFFYQLELYPQQKFEVFILAPAGMDVILRSIHPVLLSTWNSSHNGTLKVYIPALAGKDVILWLIHPVFSTDLELQPYWVYWQYWGSSH